MDINKLTIGEIATVEDIAKLPIAALGDESKPKGKLLIALAYVINKRTNPKYTQADAETLTMEEMTDLLGMNEEDKESGK